MSSAPDRSALEGPTTDGSAPDRSAPDRPVDGGAATDGSPRDGSRRGDLRQSIADGRWPLFALELVVLAVIFGWLFLTVAATGGELPW